MITYMWEMADGAWNQTTKKEEEAKEEIFKVETTLITVEQVGKMLTPNAIHHVQMGYTVNVPMGNCALQMLTDVRLHLEAMLVTMVVVAMVAAMAVAMAVAMVASILAQS